MTGTEFAELLVKKNNDSAKPVESEYLERAGFRAILRGKATSPGDLQDCLQGARKLAAKGSKLTKTEGAPGSLEEEEAPGPDLIFQRLEGEVRELRLQVFGAEAIPFPRWPDAVAWIQGIEAGQVTPPRDPEEGCKLERRMQRLKEDFETFYDCSFRIRCEGTILAYPAESRTGMAMRRAIVLKSNQKFNQLAVFVSRKSRETGLAPAFLLAFILSGIRQTPRLTVQTTRRIIGYGVAKTTYEVRSDLPTWNDHKMIYRMEHQRRASRKAPDWTKRVLLEEIRKAGGVPRRGRGVLRRGEIEVFWDLVAEKVRMRTEKDSFDGECARLRFRRLDSDIRHALYA